MIPEAARGRRQAARGPAFEIVVDDLACLSNEDLRGRSLALFPTLALWLLRDSRDYDTLLDNLAAWADAFDAIARAPTGAHPLHLLLRYLDRVLDGPQFRGFCGRLKTFAPTTEEATMHYGDEKMAEGMARGRAEGEAKGRTLAQRDTLLKQLTLKFGALDQATVDRVRAASPTELERWLERILVAPELASVFEP